MRFRQWYEKHEPGLNLLQLLLSFGGAGLIVRTVTAFFVLDWGWDVSLFAVTAGALLLAGQYLPETPREAARAAVKLASVPDAAPVLPTEPSQEEQERERERQERERERGEIARERAVLHAERVAQQGRRAAQRDALHEVLATMENKQRILLNWVTSGWKYAPNDEGDWPENRSLFTGNQNFDHVVQHTNRALHSSSLISPSADEPFPEGLVRQALQNLGSAIAIVEAALEDEAEWTQ